LRARQGKIAEAQTAVAEAIRIAEGAERKDILLRARLLSVQLEVSQDQIDKVTAVSELESLSNQWSDNTDQAAIRLDLWRYTGLDAYKQQAAQLYREAYLQTPNVEYRRYLAELGQDGLPPPPPPPPLPEIVERKSVNLTRLLAQIDEM